MKMKGFFSKNIKVVIAFILGFIISGTGVYAATAAASDVSYSPPSGSGLSSNVQSSIDELYNYAGRLKTINNLETNIKSCHTLSNTCYETSTAAYNALGKNGERGMANCCTTMCESVSVNQTWMSSCKNTCMGKITC